MIKHARTKTALDALRKAVDAGEYESATLLMESYDLHLRELTADTEAARESLQQLLDDQHLVIEHFVALRTQASDELRSLRHAGSAARAYLQ